MEKEIALLNEWRHQIDKHIETLSIYLKKNSSISNEYCKSKEEIQKDVFNVFYLISDLYYRENFHSDILRFFLDPQEKHGGGMVFLDTFIQMLNKKGKSIDTNCYEDAIVVREEGKIDILIKSESTKRAIIIENKINKAGDMWRQIPRYYDYVSKNGYSIDAILYLPLSKDKEPDMQDWSNEDKSHVCSLLVTIPAYDKSGTTNLVDDWLRPSILVSDNIDIVSTLRQYSNLITKLNDSIMDTIVLEKFYNELLQNDNLKTAQSIRSMLNALPGFLASRIQAKFSGNCFPFSRVWIYKSQDAVFEGAILNNAYYKMDIWCYEHGYDVLFWWNPDNPNYNKITEDEFMQFVNSIRSLASFKINPQNKFQCVNHFDFSNETGLYDFIAKLLEELKMFV